MRDLVIGVNPFNGIESISRLLACCTLSTRLRIHSMELKEVLSGRTEPAARRGRRIHSMELKDIRG